jgi:2,3-diketo-5-methylthio-1-phosphopentane phosphatase
MTTRATPRTAVLCDFDGTLTPFLVADALYKRFAAPSWRETTARWERGEISAPEELRINLSSVTASRAELERFLDTVPLDADLSRLVAFCRERDYPLAIVSDGLVWYIRYILARQHLDDITIYANQIEFLPHGVRISSPWADAVSPLAGTSKQTIVRRYQAQGYRVAFIGDGVTDLEVVGVADVVFARDGLLQYCRERGAPAVEANSLAQVLDQWRLP